MKCPNCSSTLQLNNSEEFSYHLCQGCEGIWVGRDSILNLIEKQLDHTPGREQEFAPADISKKVKRLCPNCSQQKLTAFMMGKVELDICPECKGVFFDKNELEQIFPNSKPGEQPSIAFCLIDILSTGWLFL